MNTELTEQAKNDFENDFYKLMNNSVLVSEPNYHITKWFSENLLTIEMKKIKIKMNKLVYLGLSILEISKTLMYEFWYDYMKPKYGDHVKLCYMDTDNFIMHLKTEIADDVKKGLILLIMLMNVINHCLKERIKK